MELDVAFEESLARADMKCAEFYSLYYLAKIEKIEECDALLETLTKDLAKDFYNYGLFAVTRECRHVGDHFNILGRDDDGREDGYGSYRYISDNMRDESSDYYLEKTVIKKIGMEHKSLIMNLANLMYGSSNIDGIKNFLSINVKDTKEYLGVVGRLFEMDKWEEAYGGKRWAKITKVIARYGEVEDILFVDRMFNLAHNNGSWIDKIYLRYSKSLLKELLDNNFNGDFRNIKFMINASFNCNPILKNFAHKLPSRKMDDSGKRMQIYKDGMSGGDMGFYLRCGDKND